MKLCLQAQKSSARDHARIKITGSKSESNRLLILQALFPQLEIKNLSNSDDTQHLQQVLNSNQALLDIGHAGTAMRFGTAYFASKPGKNIVLTGSDRMQERPIGILVNALNTLGAQITYVNKIGYPPLKIMGQQLHGDCITIDGNVSSQYITALMLMGVSLPRGLQIRMVGAVTSRPYLEMTQKLLEQIGGTVHWHEDEGNTVVHVKPLQKVVQQTLVVESDWSSAGYWYSWVALQDAGYRIELSSYRKDSLQGDSALVDIYKKLGVETTFLENTIELRKVQGLENPSRLEIDLTQQPDQAQTIFATCLGLSIDLKMTGLHTLRIKETDRIHAMKVEGARFRESEIITTADTIELLIAKNKAFAAEVTIDTYNDHRMALAFAPLCLKTKLMINDADVVTKSYGDYWKDMKAVSVDITEI